MIAHICVRKVEAQREHFFVEGFVWEGVVQEANMVQESRRKKDVHICAEAYKTGRRRTLEACLSFRSLGSPSGVTATRKMFKPSPKCVKTHTLVLQTLHLHWLPNWTSFWHKPFTFIKHVTWIPSPALGDQKAMFNLMISLEGELFRQLSFQFLPTLHNKFQPSNLLGNTTKQKQKGSLFNTCTTVTDLLSGC